MHTTLLAVLLLLSAVLVVAGVAEWSTGASLITAGLLLALWSIAVLADIGGPL